MADLYANGAGIHIRISRVICYLVIGYAADYFALKPYYVMRTGVYFLIFRQIIEVIAVVYRARARICNIVNYYLCYLLTAYAFIKVFVCGARVFIDIEQLVCYQASHLGVGRNARYVSRLVCRRC